MRWASVVIVCVAVSAGGWLSGGGGTAAAQTSAEREEMRRVFLQRIDEYVALHRHLERLLPPEVVSSDLQALFAPRMALGREIRKARRGARQGDIFTPGVAVYFRVVIAESLRGEGISDLLAIIEEENAVHTPARVNGDYPAGRSIAAIPPCLLAAMPALPPELHYSFIGRDLILWDMHAGLIVDFAPKAVPLFTCPAN